MAAAAPDYNDNNAGPSIEGEAEDFGEWPAKDEDAIVPMGIFEPSYLQKLFPPGAYDYTEFGVSAVTQLFIAEPINLVPDGEEQMKQRAIDKKSFSGRMKKFMEKVTRAPKKMETRIGRAPSAYIGLELVRVSVAKSRDNFLGKGSFGEVHKARGFFVKCREDPKAEQPPEEDMIEMVIVCKEMKRNQSGNVADKREYSHSDKVKFKFPLEFLALASMRHVNIMLLFDYTQVETKMKWFGFFEFCAGGSLADHILRKRAALPADNERRNKIIDIVCECRKRGIMNPQIAGDVGGLSELELRGLLRQILKGLHFCDRHGFAHFDIKVDNILLTKSGICKLADFGMAQPVLQAKKSGEHKTRHVLTMQGTPIYMSMEMLKWGARAAPAIREGVPPGSKGYEFDGHVSDIFSVGVVAYVAFYGRFPYDIIQDFQHHCIHFAKMAEERERGPAHWLPRLELARPVVPYSDAFIQFLTLALEPDWRKRPRARGLMESAFLSAKEDVIIRQQQAYNMD